MAPKIDWKAARKRMKRWYAPSPPDSMGRKAGKKMAEHIKSADLSKALRGK